MGLSYVLAVLAAACNAASNILQHEANRQEPPEVAMHLQLILDLVRRPLWLMGLATVIASFVLDAAALSMGRLAAVQPILVLELPLTLIAGALFVRSAPLRTREWTAVAVMTVGLAAFIFFLNPTGAPGHHVPALTWIFGVAVSVGAMAACIAGSSRRGSGRRAALLGLAAGIGFGLTAAFMKSATAPLHHAPLHVLTTWSTYAMAVSGLVAMFLMQNALQAGRLIAAQPGITLGDPAVAVLWGVLGFNEQIRGGAYLIGTIVAGMALAIGVVILSGSPLLANEVGGGREPAAEATGPPVA